MRPHSLARFSSALLLAAASLSPSLALGAPAATPAKAGDELATQVCASMTLEEKVAQMIMSYPPIKPETPVKVGGIILLGSLLKNAESVKARIADVQSRAKIPVMVAADMEGGQFNRLKFVKALNQVPSHRELGKQTEKESRAVGRKVGRGMRELGFNCNLSPVLDLADKGLMFESGRSMGADPETVAKLGKAYSEGLWAEGVIPVGKHFPGYGALESNSDHYLIIAERTAEEVDRHASAFFGTGEALGGVMLANVGYTAYGSVPAIFAPELVELAHAGGWFTMTDDLSVKILSKVTRDDQHEVVRRAFLAGNDMLLTTSPLDWEGGLHVDRIILDLVKEHPELVARIDQSVVRILKAKQRAGMLKGLQPTSGAAVRPPATRATAASVP